jgi:HEAT repeat protein
MGWPDVRHLRLPQAWHTNRASQIGEPDVIWPLIRADRDRVAAMMVRAIDQDAVYALGAYRHFSDMARCPT